MYILAQENAIPWALKLECIYLSSSCDICRAGLLPTEAKLYEISGSFLICLDINTANFYINVIEKKTGI